MIFVLTGNTRQLYQLSVLKMSQEAVAISHSIELTIQRLGNETVLEMQRQRRGSWKAWWNWIIPSRERFTLPLLEKQYCFSSPLLTLFFRYQGAITAAWFWCYPICVPMISRNASIWVITTDFQTDGNGKRIRGVIPASEPSRVATMGT